MRHYFLRTRIRWGRLSGTLALAIAPIPGASGMGRATAAAILVAPCRLTLGILSGSF